MAKQLITKCPHCNTLFKLHTHQIEAAGGFVRCGSCMKVFKAHKNIFNADQLPTLDDLNSPATAKPVPPNPTPTQLHTQQNAPHWHNNLSNDIDRMYQQLQETVSPNAKSPTHQPEDKKKSNSHDDWAAALLAQLEEDTPPAPREKPATKPEPSLDLPPKPPEPSRAPAKKALLLEGNISENVINLPKASAKAPFQLDSPPNMDPEPNDAWAEAMLSEIDQATPEQLLKKKPVKADPLLKPSILNSQGAQKNSLQDTLEALPSYRKMRLEDSSPNHHLSDHNKQTPILQDGPDEDWLEAHKKTSIKQHIAYLLGTFVLLLILTTEHAYLNFTMVAQTPHFRPPLKIACHFLGCQLPLLQNTQLIVNEKSRFSAHPDHPNALKIDTVLRNTANFNQPFPDLQLVFKDIDLQTLAQRRLRPSEYLNHDFPKDALMPINRPIQLTIEILDPGKAAVNWEIVILPNHS